jgi:hypothetical protein
MKKKSNRQDAKKTEDINNSILRSSWRPWRLGGSISFIQTAGA